MPTDATASELRRDAPAREARPRAFLLRYIAEKTTNIRVYARFVHPTPTQNRGRSTRTPRCVARPPTIQRWRRMLSCRLALPKTRPSRRPIIINTHVTLGAAPGSRVLPWPHRTHRSVDSPALPQPWPDSIEALPHQYRPLLERTEEALITRIGPTQRDRAPRASPPQAAQPACRGRTPLGARPRAIAASGAD